MLYVRGLSMSIIGLIYLNKIGLYVFDVNIKHTGAFLLNSLAGFLAIASYYISLRFMTLSTATILDGMLPLLLLYIDLVFFMK